MFKMFGVWKDEKDDDILDEVEVDDELTVDVTDDIDEPIEDEIGQVALDVLEGEDYLYIVAPIAGVELNDIDISLQKTVLTIKGKRNKPEEYSEDGIIIRNSECYYWKFVRNIILPENLGLDKIRAYMDNNTLIISIPKLKFDSQTIKIDKFES